jgi:hypothetical protein
VHIDVTVDVAEVATAGGVVVVRGRTALHFARTDSVRALRLLLAL